MYGKFHEEKNIGLKCFNQVLVNHNKLLTVTLKCSTDFDDEN